MNKINFKQIIAQKISEISWIPENEIINLIEIPPEKELWDYAFPCFILAKTLRKSPIEIAKDLAEKISWENFEKVQNIWWYVNFFINKNILIENILLSGKDKYSSTKRVIVEFMNANPNKPLHIWQWRNICIWDSLVKIFKYLWYQTDAVNYWDDSWVNVWYNIVWHLYYNMPLETNKKFDHYCGDIYTSMRKNDEDPEFKQKLSETLLKIERWNDPIVNKLQNEYTRKCVLWQLETCWRLWSYFDLINWETDILHMQLFEHAIEMLKKTWYIRYEDSGEAAWCWIVDLSSLAEFAKEEKQYQIIIKSDWVATYTWKDIAYAMWKLWKLWKDFFYDKFCVQPNSQELYTTKSVPSQTKDKTFWNYNLAIAVIDNRQSFAQKVVKWSLNLLGFTDKNSDYVHLAYGVVYLTPATLLEFGYELSDEEAQQTRLPFSTRKWWFITIDQTLDILKSKAYQETQKRNPNLSESQLQDIAEKIASWSFRFFLTKSDLTKDITFDINEVLDMEWETGAYVLYSYARINSILTQSNIDILNQKIDYKLLVEDMEFQLTKKIAEFDDMIQLAGVNYEPFLVCRYMIELSRLFNSYYAKVTILKADENTKYARLALLNKIRETLKISMELVWMKTVERM